MGERSGPDGPRRRKDYKRGDDKRGDYARGLPGYHDPTAGIGGASPAQSALTLRLWLAGFGLLFCAGGTVVAAQSGPAWLAVAFGVLAVVAAVDLVWVAHRKRRGEPG